MADSGEITVFSARLSSVAMGFGRRGSAPKKLSLGASAIVTARSQVAAKKAQKRAGGSGAHSAEAADATETLPAPALTVVSIEQLRSVKTAFLEVLATKPEDRSDKQLDVVVRECESIPFFQNFRRDQRFLVARVLQMREVSRGTVVVREGARGDCLFIVLFGSCAVLKRADDEPPPSLALETTRASSRNLMNARADASEHLGVEQCGLEPGDAFGERALLTEAGRRKASVVAKTDSILLVITRENFLHAFARQLNQGQSIGWAPQVARTVLGKVRRTAEDIEVAVVYLLSFFFFRQIDRDVLEAIVGAFELRTLGENELLYEKGDPVNALSVILSGRVVLQPRVASVMTPTSPRPRRSRASRPNATAKGLFNAKTSAKLISTLEAGLTSVQSRPHAPTGASAGSSARSGNDHADTTHEHDEAAGVRLVYRPGDAFGDVELRAPFGDNRAIGEYVATEPTEEQAQAT